MFSPRIQLVLLSVTFLIASYISGMTHHNHQVHNQIRRLQKEDVSRNPAATPRQSPHVARDYHQLHSGLFKRDTCGAVFPGRYTDSCGSEATTCCIIPGMQRPACVEILGKGACCTEHIDCFVDTKSDCDDTESEQCAVDVCCPKNTHCVDGVKYNNPDDIRCNFDRAFIPGYVITSKMSEKPVARNTASPDRSTSTKKHKRTGTDFSDLPTSTESHRHTIKKSADSSTTTKRHKHTTTTSSDPVELKPIETINQASDISLLPASEGTTTPGAGLNEGIRGAAIAGVAVGAILTAICIGSLAGYCIFKRIKSRSRSKPKISYPILPPEMCDGSQIFEAQTSRGPFYESGSTQVYEAPGVKNEIAHEIGCVPARIHEAPSGKGAFFDPRAPPPIRERHAQVEMPTDPPRSMGSLILKVLPGLSDVRGSGINSAPSFTLHGRQATSPVATQDLQAAR